MIDCFSDNDYYLLLFPVMPVMDGPDATKAIRDLGVTCPIFGVTGNTLDADIRRFMDCGATDVYIKPFDMGKFTAAMNEIVIATKFLVDDPKVRSNF